jgi:hypothetical protein
MGYGFSRTSVPPASMANQPPPAAKGRRKEKNSRKGSARVGAFFVDGWVMDILSLYTKCGCKIRPAMRMVDLAVVQLHLPAHFNVQCKHVIGVRKNHVPLLVAST